MHMAYRRAGTVVPRDADQQEEAATEVAAADARPGDLVTYDDTDGTGDHATHIASGSATGASSTRRSATASTAFWRRTSRTGSGLCDAVSCAFKPVPKQKPN
jgi:cell wall-associated NlpC family hydrolase